MPFTLDRGGMDEFAAHCLHILGFRPFLIKLLTQCNVVPAFAICIVRNNASRVEKVIMAMHAAVGRQGLSMRELQSHGIAVFRDEVGTVHIGASEQE